MATPTPPNSALSATGHLLLIDGLNIVRRIYEANPVEDSVEKAEAAIRNSLFSFTRALNTYNPTHVLAPFDFGGLTWRHELYADYKIKRKPMPAELWQALPGLYTQLADMGVATILVPGVEADDVLATVVSQWDIARRGPITVLSTDKDIAALTAKGAQVVDHFNRVVRDESWIVGKFGVSSALLQDLLALAGDSSDGIPGVPGVATKTAAKLLNEHGSLDQVMAQAATVKGKVGENLRASLDVVRLSRKLVEFKTDLKLGITWNSIRVPQRTREPHSYEYAGSY